MIQIRLLPVILALLFLGGCASKAEKPVDTHFSGAYQFDDGTLVTLSPSNETRMRVLRISDGKPFSLYHDEKGGFKVSEGFNSQEFFASGKLNYDANGEITYADWLEGDVQKSLKRLPLIRKEIMFKSGDLTLRGELTLPPGKGPFPVVITVHGSEDSSAVDYYHWPYLLAANGIAGFKFDKRGTGGSDGKYTQNFPTLAGDVIAAMKRLESESAIDMGKVNLLGFSQGGWIAPLVASQADIQSYIVAFGTTVTVPMEDRWGYVKQLLDNGFGDKEIAHADEFNEQITKIMYYHDESAWDELIALKEKHQDAPWFKIISGSDSMMGRVAERLTHPMAKYVPNFAWKMYTKWKRGSNNGPSFNRTYQPLKTLEKVTTPSMWLMAGEDTSLPTPDTITDLTRLASQGTPVEYKVYDGAEHGNIIYTTNEAGKRKYLGYVPSYFTDVVDYFKAQND